MAGNANDMRLFFTQFPQRTRRLGCDGTSRPFTEALPRGKYVCHFVGLGVNTAWVRVGAFVIGTPLVAVVPGALAPGVIDVINEFPIDTAVPAFVLHVRKPGAGDSISVILSAGTATLVINQLSES
jgi:hypothetical protein